ncbi:hypothetical protein Pint_31391 [Pistacia integerrima]|uniref:Uncharacterized protein n=1 Tax=Pistacia integerrima TaxID=434235 RepID=A0ACC0XLA0_9ROSI|nr:hypothetical protein Pint_31391 [Pistacia integerrima]
MIQQTASQHTHLLQQNLQPPKKLHLLPLIFLIFFEVAGGPYGEEQAVGAAGPLFAILGFLIFPFIWSIPEALVTAELATTFPGNGGYVIWAHRAFGPFWGSLMGSWKFLSGVINLASYPVLCIDYLKLIIPVISSGIPHYFAVFLSTCVLSFVNYTGLAIVGYTAVTLGVFSLLPFVVFTLVAIPKIDPARWISLGQGGVKKDWTLFFNTLFWNLNFWDNASTLAGEVEHPQSTFPKALFSAGLLTCLAYLIPLLAATGAVPLDQENWVDGLGMLLEFASFLWLRKKLAEIERPFRVPMAVPGLVVLCLVPSVFLVYVMAVATKTVYLVSALLTLFGIFWYFFMKFCKSKMWLEFKNVEEEFADGEFD